MIQFDSKILDRDKEYQLGFSGGVDSLAALHFLLRGGWNIKPVHIVHFNTEHSLGIRDEVKFLWDLLGIEKGEFVDVLADSEPNEANAYSIRQGVWAGREVILCNHLNDLAEGYFINCMQGKPNQVPLRAVNGPKYRPFLRTKKKDFYKYLLNNELTNLVVPDDMISLRGKLRGTVFPTLEDDWTAAAKKLFVETGAIYEKPF